MGVTLVETIVVGAIVLLVVLLLLISLGGQRELARETNCKMNLKRIGESIIVYDQVNGRLPEVAGSFKGAPSPYVLLVGSLGISSFREPLKQIKPRKKDRVGEPLPDLIEGLTCSSDPNAIGLVFRTPVNYRFNTGDDPAGAHGPFAPGARIAIADVEAADGATYTVAVSERLVGTGKAEPDRANPSLAGGPVGAEGCPDALDRWTEDAGSSWRECDWKSTLYNHAPSPNAPRSCIATDGLSAFLGASSGHRNFVQALMLDGGVRSYTNSVDLKIWRGAATTGIPHGQ